MQNYHILPHFQSTKITENTGFQTNQTNKVIPRDINVKHTDINIE